MNIIYYLLVLFIFIIPVSNTNAVISTVNGITATGSSSGGVTDVTGTSPVISSGGATPAISISGVTSAQGNGSKLQLSTGTTTTNNAVKFDANGNVVDAGFAAAAVSVTSLSPSLVVSPSPGISTFTLATADTINAQGTAATYTIATTDMGETVTHNKATAVAVTLPQATTTGFTAGNSYTECNLGAGLVTITPTTSTINGQATATLVQGQCDYIISDGTNYVAFVGTVIWYPTNDSTAYGSTMGAGVGALQNITASSAAFNTTAFGYQSFNGSITTGGVNNTGFGFKTGLTVTSGHDNTFMGRLTGNKVTTGSSNTYLGSSIGGSAASGATSSSTLVGANVGASITGSNNTIMGASAGTLITTGNANTILGAAVGSTTLTTGADNILIGVNNAITTSASGTGNTINIGGTGGSWVLVTGTDTNTTANTVAHGVWNLPDLTQTSVAQTGTVCWGTAGVLTVDTTVACLASLEELKDIKEGGMPGALAEIKQLEPFWYTWKKSTDQYMGDKAEQPGLGAHATEAVDKRLVGYGPDGNLRGVRYQQMVALLVAGMQEQQAEIDMLKNEAVPYHKCFFGLLMCPD